MIVSILPHQVRTLDQVRGFLDGNEMGFRIANCVVQRETSLSEGAVSREG